MKSKKARQLIKSGTSELIQAAYSLEPQELRECIEYIATEAVELAEQEAEERHCHETRWRSVEEELPKPSVKVLVKRNPDVLGGDPAEYQLCYRGVDAELGTCWFQCGKEDFGCRITHWKLIE